MLQPEMLNTTIHLKTSKVLHTLYAAILRATLCFSTIRRAVRTDTWNHLFCVWVKYCYFQPGSKLGAFWNFNSFLAFILGLILHSSTDVKGPNHQGKQWNTIYYTWNATQFSFVETGDFSRKFLISKWLITNPSPNSYPHGTVQSKT